MLDDSRYDDFDFGGPADGGCYVDAFDDRDGPYGPGSDPVMHDCRPYGWGIESFEDPALLAANETMNARWFGGPYRCLSWSEMIAYGAWHQERNRLWQQASTRDARIQSEAERRWDRFCGTSKTHTEACLRYSRWANRRTGKQLDLYGK